MRKCLLPLQTGCLFLAILWLPLVGVTQSNPDLVMLINRTWEKSYELSNQQLERELTKEDAALLKKKFIPTLAVSGGYGYELSRFKVDLDPTTIPIINIPLFSDAASIPTRGNVLNGGINSQFVLFSGGQIPAAIKALEAKEKAQAIMEDKTRLDLADEVIKAYEQLLLIQQVEIVLEETAKRLDAEKILVERSISAGLTTPYDRKKIEAAMLGLAAKREETAGKRNLLVKLLHTYSGIGADTISNFRGALMPLLVDTVTNTVVNRPEVKALEASTIALQLKQKALKKEFVPKVAGLVSLQYFNLFDMKFKSPLTDRDLKLNTFQAAPLLFMGVGFKWEVFNSGKTRSEIRQAQLEINKNANTRNEALEKLDLLWQQSKLEYQVANHNIEIKEKQEEISKDALDIATRSYREGLMGITERLAAEMEYQQAVLDKWLAIQAQRRAAVQLLKSNGTLNPKIFQ